MRKFLILVILFGIMVSLLAFDFGTNLLPFEPKTLAVTGFILIAAYTMGEIVQKFGPPKVVGYIFAGILFGPYLPEVLEALFGWNIPKLFSKEIAAKDLALVNKLALGLIGLTAGGELLVGQLKKDARNILGVIGSQTLFVSLAVGSAAFALAALYPAAFPFLPQDFAQGWKSYVAISMLLGALAVGTSPATTLAVISETRAQGPLKNLTLGLIIAKDVTTVTFYLLMLAFAAVLATGKAFELSVLVHIAEELGYAIALGALLGLAFWAYLRWVKAEVMLVTIAVVFLGNYIAEAVHAEALLLFIAAGFVVAHGDQLFAWITTTWKARKGIVDEDHHDHHHHHGDGDHHDDHHHDVGHEMIEQLERISLPTFVVFFTIAAAKLDLTALPKYWIIVLLYIVVRAVSITAATQLAVKKLQAPEIIQRNLWLGMFAQGGVTLTISAFVATRGVSWGAEFSTIIMATLLVDIVAGPVLLKYGLTRSGEAASPNPDGTSEADEDDPSEETTPEVPNLLAVDFPEPSFESKRLNKELLHIRSELLKDFQTIQNELIQPRQETQHAVYEQTLSLITTHLRETHASFVELCDEYAQQPPDADREGHERRRLKRLVRDHRRIVAQSIEHTLEEHGFPTPPDPNEVYLKRLLSSVEELTAEQGEPIDVAQDESLFSPSEDDTTYVRFIKRLKRLIRSFGGMRTREVQLLHLVRYYLELSLPERLIDDAKALSGQQRHAWKHILRLHAFSDNVYLHALSTLDNATLTPPTNNDENGDNEHTPKPAVEVLRTHFEHSLALLDPESTEHDTNLPREVRLSLERSLENVSTVLRNTLAIPYNNLLNAARIAGTFELPERHYNASRIFDDSNKARQRLELTIQQQRALTHGSNNRTQAALHMVDVQSTVRRTLDAALSDVRSRLFKPLQTFPNTLSKRIKQSQTILEDQLLSGANPHDLQQHIQRQQTHILSYHKDKIIQEIDEIRSTRRLDEILDALRESLRSLTNTQTLSLLPAQETEVENLTDEDIENLHERSVPLQTLLHEALSREVAVRLSDADMRLHILIDRASADFTEIARIVRFNLEAAANELASYTKQDSSPPLSSSPTSPLKPKLNLDSSGLVTEAGIEHPRDFIMDGLTRANERAQNLLLHVQESRLTIESLLLDETVKQLRKVLKLVLEGSYNDIQDYISHPEDQPTPTPIQQPSSKSAVFLRSLTHRWLENHHPSDLDELRQNLTHEDSNTIPLHRQLSALDERISTWGHEDLPHTYRRLFNPQATEVSDFFISRPELMRNFNDAVEQWLQNRYTSVTIIGEPGSGRQSFIEEVMRTRLEGMPVIRRHLTHTIQSEADLASEISSLLGGPRTSDLARLRARLSHQNERVVIILEDAENLFLRSLNGMSTIQQFMHVLSETGQKILWVLTMDLHAWRYLDTMTHIRQRFTHPLVLRPLTRDELQEVILSRHRVSGLDLTYNSEARGFQQVRMLLAKLQNRTEDRQKILQDIFFDQLYDLSQGNPLLGIYYWLQSVQPLPEDDDILRVQPPEAITIPFLHTLDTETLMTLSNIVLHDGLTVHEFAEVFRVTDAQAQTALRHLLHLRLVYIETGSQDRYKLNRVLYLTVTETLRERNLL